MPEAVGIKKLLTSMYVFIVCVKTLNLLIESNIIVVTAEVPLSSGFLFFQKTRRKIQVHF